MRPFNGNTFVAFCDIAGFKAALKEGQDRAARFLDAFYSAGFNSIANNRDHGPHDVDGLFVSDCGVLIAREGTPVEKLFALCNVLRGIHNECHRNDVNVSTSIAYGPFQYENRFVIPGIEKQMFLGSAYVTAYIDHSAGTPKLYHPDIRILKENLPDDAMRVCSDANDPLGGLMRNAKAHFYYEWRKHQGN